MSILDYQRKELCPDFWRSDGVMRDGTKKFIELSVLSFFEDLNIDNCKDFVSDLYVGSSLATYFYKEDSDLDVKVIIDLPIFMECNPYYKNMSNEELLDFLGEKGSKNSWLTAIIPGTLHPLDAYFFSSEEAIPINLNKYDSLYKLSDNTWLKPPRKLEGELSPSYVLNLAKEKAKIYIDKIVSDIEQTKRDSIDFLVLHDFMKTLDKDDLQHMQIDFETTLERVNTDIEGLIVDKEIIKSLRKKAFSKKDLVSDFEKLFGSINYSDENLIFKIMQRYGYMRILVEISDLFKNKSVNSDDVKDVIDILR